MTAERTGVGYVGRKRTEYDGRHGPEIDLGLGTSPIGPAPELREPLAKRDPFFALSRYPNPDHIVTRTNILRSIGLDGNLSHENVILHGNGSYSAGDEATRCLTRSGVKRIYVPTYSFPNVSQWTIRHGIEYVPVSSNTLDPEASLKAMLALEDLKDTAVYIDYPNNPTGYANPETLRQVVNHVYQNGAVPFIDGAYAEVLGDEYRASFQYVLDRGGLALGSLSKTQGLPGLRAGYLILGNGHTENGYHPEQRLLFGLCDEAEFVYEKLFEMHDGENTLASIHARRVAEHNTRTNSQLYERLSSLGLTILPTDLRTPIQVVVSKAPDFYQRLLKVGIVTESLEDYASTLNGQEGFSHSAVRMITPGPGQVEEVTRRISIALSL